MAVVRRMNFWDATLRDKWLQAPEPNWLPSPFPAGSHVHPKIFHRWVWQALPAFTFRDHQCRRFVQTQQDRAKERLHEDHVRTVLEAVGPASGSPGQTMICTFCQYHMSGGASCPPEDIALRAAEAIAVFRRACNTRVQSWGHGTS